MKANIITNHPSGIHNSNKGPLKLNFDKIKKENIYLDMEVEGVPKKVEIIWNVYSDGELLDGGDLTKGKKAEFCMLRSYAGTVNRPHTFTISAKSSSSNEELAKFDIQVFAKPKIMEAYWADRYGKRIYEASMNNPFTICFNGYGLYKIPLNLKCFLKSTEGKDLEIPTLSRHMRIDYEYESDYLYIDKDTLLDNPKFFIKEIYSNLMVKLKKGIIFSKPGLAPNLKIVKAYFQISHGKSTLYDGKKDKKGELEIVIDVESIKAMIAPPEEITSLSPVRVYSEEYFTQKYEPCKFEKISFKYGNNAEKTIFDEKEATKKEANGTFKNEKITISAIVPPAGSKNIQKLKIKLDGVDTKDCSLNEKNKALTSEPDKNSKEHKGSVIDTKELEEAKIEYIFDEPDKKITIAPSFNYQYDKNTAKEFIQNYFLFSGMLSNTDPIVNTFKGTLMNWEAESKNIIDIHRIGLETCRYKKSLYLKTYADVAWAFHALIDDPYLPEYYNGNGDIVTIQGLDKELDGIKDDPIFNNFVAPIMSPALQVPFIRNFIFQIIKDIADKYEFGLTAYYDFDAKGKKNDKQIDYAETHPEFFKALVAGFTTLEILIDVLLIILTEGAALANFIAKAGKVTKIIRKSGKIIKGGDKIIRAGEKATERLSRYSTVFSTAKGAQYAKSTFELMKGSYFRAYRYMEDKDIGIQPLLEERVKISPLINLGVAQKKSLGALLLDQTPQGKALNIVINFTGGFQIGASGLFISKLGEKGKSLVGWGKAITYPMKVVNTVFEGTYELLAFATDEAVKKIFGAEAEFEKDITAHMDFDFWLKIHTANQKIHLQKFNKKQPPIIAPDKSSVSIAPSGAFTVRIKLSGSVASKDVLVRAMNILTWRNKEEKVTEFNAEGKFEVEGNVFIERRYSFEAKHKPYYQDRVVFTGLGGEYMYKVKAKKREKDDKKPIDTIEEKEEIRTFILLAPCEIGFDPSEMTKNPSKNNTV